MLDALVFEGTVHEVVLHRLVTKAVVILAIVFLNFHLVFLIISADFLFFKFYSARDFIFEEDFSELGIVIACLIKVNINGLFSTCLQLLIQKFIEIISEHMLRIVHLIL